MKQVITFILSLSVMSLTASRVYNPEATQKLQEKYRNTVKKNGPIDLTLTAQPEFLKELEKSLVEGADPNVLFKEKDMHGDLSVLETIVLAPLWNNNVNVSEAERMLKIALDHGVKIDFTADPKDKEKRYIIFAASQLGDPNILKMMINAGENEQQIQQNKDRAIKALEEIIKEDIEVATRVNNQQKVLDAIKSQVKTNEAPKPNIKNFPPGYRSK